MEEYLKENKMALVTVDSPAKMEKVADVRAHLSKFIDAAQAGQARVFARDGKTVTIVDANRLVQDLRLLHDANAEITIQEDNSWAIFLKGLPISGEGETLDEALDETILSLRDYAEAWVERLRYAPNHESNWGLVQIIQLSNDDSLKEWLSAA